MLLFDQPVVCPHRGLCYDQSDRTHVGPKAVASIRRLAAIFAADAAGYSRLMGADEEGTLDRLNAYRREIVDPKIEEQAPRVGAGGPAGGRRHIFPP